MMLTMMIAVLLIDCWGMIDVSTAFTITENNIYLNVRSPRRIVCHSNILSHHSTSFPSSKINSFFNAIQSSSSSSSLRYPSFSSSSCLLATSTPNEFHNDNHNNDHFDHNHVVVDDDNDSDCSSMTVETTRREVFEKAAGIAFAWTILDASSMMTSVADAATVTDKSTTSSTPPPSKDAPQKQHQQQQQQRVIVMTGANSGIGYEACKRMMQQQQEMDPTTTIILACRTFEKAKDTVVRLMSENDSNKNNNIQFIPAECNLASLQSIQRFVTTFFTATSIDSSSTISNSNTMINPTFSNVDVVALNAGISRNINSDECIRTNDGFELTIGTNHFGHFYLTYLLLPFLLLKKEQYPLTKKIVVTASSVHDPDSLGGAQGEKATLGQLDGLIKQGRQCEMIDGQPFNADKAYKDSKVNV
jgi:NAD(P)-dependent dehydrogenase (short-subunit alcohol dehydrogenase family)